MQPARVRGLLYGLMIALGILSAVAVRVVTSAASELRIAEHARARGDLEAAVVHYRRAARWYAPASPYHVRALGQLAAIGAAAERRGDVELALCAYRAIRAAIMSSRSWYVPESVRLRLADERIASLMATQPAPPMDAGKSRDQLRREHLALLQANPDPSVAWTAVLLLGFASWLGGAFAFVLRAIDDEDRFIPREVWRWSSMIVVGFALFVLGMSLA